MKIVRATGTGKFTVNNWLECSQTEIERVGGASKLTAYDCVKVELAAVRVAGVRKCFVMFVWSGCGWLL